MLLLFLAAILEGQAGQQQQFPQAGAQFRGEKALVWVLPTGVRSSDKPDLCHVWQVALRYLIWPYHQVLPHMIS